MNRYYECVENCKSTSSKLTGVWHGTFKSHFSRHFGTLAWFSDCFDRFWCFEMCYGHFSRTLQRSGHRLLYNWTVHEPTYRRKALHNGPKIRIFVKLIPQHLLDISTCGFHCWIDLFISHRIRWFGIFWWGLKQHAARVLLHVFYRVVCGSGLKPCRYCIPISHFWLPICLTIMTWWPEMTLTSIRIPQHWYLYLGQMSDTLALVICWLCLRLTRAWPGSQPNAVDRGGGGRITPPQANSQTNDRSETGRAALERSRRDGSKALLKFFLKRSRVKSRSGQRSKLSVSAFWFSEPPTWLTQAQTRPKHSQRLDEGTLWV